MIDYFMLWRVKMGWMSRENERVYNIWINVWVRSPGCLFASFLALPMILAGTWAEALGPAILAGLSFWNGQYYMMKAVKRKSLETVRHKLK